MKLIIQIPCFNEAECLAATIAALPRRLPGIDEIEVLVIDDGSSDGTHDLASSIGVHHVERHRTNRGLAAAFRTGLQRALDERADIIVNTDADNQYHGADIAALVEPIVAGRADVVIGDRGVGANKHFGWFKRRLQSFGSAIVRRLSRTNTTDAVSGFRAMSRKAAQRINITSDFSYTTEMLIQAGRKRMAVVSVPVRTNGAVRPSRLFRSIPQFLTSTGITIVRVYSMYNPLRVFVGIGALALLVGLAPIVRFFSYYFSGHGQGHIQSLIIGGALIVLGFLTILLGALADLIARNRLLLEQTLERVRMLEDGVRATAEAAGSAQHRGRRRA